MLRARDGYFIQTFHHGVRFPAILIQHNVELSHSKNRPAVQLDVQA